MQTISPFYFEFTPHTIIGGAYIMPKRKRKNPSSEMNMIKLVQNKTDTPAVLKKKVSDINSLKVKKWVEETQL